MVLYYIALILLIIRTVTFGTTWAFEDGSYELLGNFIAEFVILIAFIRMNKQIKKGEAYKESINNVTVTKLGGD